MPTPNTLVIMGSARSTGHTKEAVDTFLNNSEATLMNLLDYNIAPYDYDSNYHNDDFLMIAKRMTEADKILFATPVYWYTMSGLMKTFFDRFTDLITIEKPTGRALKGKECYILACGAGPEIPQGFEIPFSATCDYLDMEYKEALYYYAGRNPELLAQNENNVKQFAQTIMN